MKLLDIQTQFTDQNDFPVIQPVQIPGQEPNRNNFDPEKVANSGVRLIDQITSLPGRIGDFADDLNDKFIETAQRFKSGSSEAAERNLKGGFIQGKARNIGAWLSSPKNAGLAVVVAVIAIFIIRRL